ncbi:MAG TPA: lipopolysaccharide heptosyltransferase II [Thermoguttaceae bacterium]|nr:lipopolysaccharide heptosyltransferase II [Thermoguttaceae bacterium]
MNIGLFLPNWLGDLVMATPALRAIRRHFDGSARLVGILRPNLAELLAGTNWLDEQWPFDPRAKDRQIGQRSLVRRMRRRRFDLVLLFPNSLRTAILAWQGRARERIGYVADWRGPLLTGKVYPRRENGRVASVPLVDYYLALAEAAGCPPESRRLELVCTKAEEEVAESIWRKLGLRTDGRVIALNSSGAYGEAKLWPEKHFGELARRVADETDHDVLVICGPDERGIARRIASQACHPRVFSLADQRLGLATSKACIRRSWLIVSTDSGPRHVAAAFGKPVITLFGPTMPIWVANPTVRSVDLQLDLDCIGCGRPVCPLRHHQCMQELQVETVHAEVVKLLDEEASVQAA